MTRTVHPIQAGSAKGGIHSIQKEASDVVVGDIVFCQVQRSQQYYAHTVLEVEHSRYYSEPRYWIGNILRHFNGWCLREHIFGIFVEVEVWVAEDGDWQYVSRPLPKTVFAEVQELIENNRWNRAAATLCKPRRVAHSSGSRSDN